MKITTKLGLLFAGIIIVFILLGVTLLAQMRHVSNGYDALLASPVRDIDAARVVQVNFKKEVQEWKDTLLRGHKAADLAKYGKQFREQEAAVRAGAVALSQTVEDQEAHKLLVQFIAADDVMSAKYKRAYDVYVAGNADFKAADALVRGQDRAPTDLFDKVVQRLEPGSSPRSPRSSFPCAGTRAWRWASPPACWACWDCWAFSRSAVSYCVWPPCVTCPGASPMPMSKAFRSIFPARMRSANSAKA
jgi:hypothetical protein